MPQNQDMLPMERRAFQITRTDPVAPMGTVNTAVLDYAAAPVPKWGTPFTNGIGSTAAVPTPGSGTWVNIINSTTLGTTIKFCKKGTYRFDAVINVPVVAEITPLIVAALILDSSAATMLVATAILPTTLNAFGAAGVIGWSIGEQNASVVTTLNFGGTVYITDAQAGGAQPSGAGATGVGCVRMHINDGAGGGFATDALITSLWCEAVNDIAG